MDIYSYFTISGVMGIATIISLILALISGCLVFYLFLDRKNENKFHGFAGLLYDFFSFKKIISENLLQIFYLISAVFLTLFALCRLFIGVFDNLASAVLSFLLIGVVGNVFLRIFYEVIISIFIIRRNTMKDMKSSSAEKKEAVSAKNPDQKNAAHSAKATASQLTQQKVVFCRNCGNSYSAQVSICPHCGKPKEK